MKEDLEFNDVADALLAHFEPGSTGHRLGKVLLQIGQERGGARPEAVVAAEQASPGDRREAGGPQTGRDGAAERPAGKDESYDQFLRRLGVDAKAWGDELAKAVASNVKREMRWGDHSVEAVQRIASEIALGYFANFHHALDIYEPRSPGGEIQYQDPPDRAWFEERIDGGQFDHFSDAARMLHEYLRIPAHKYIASQKILEVFGQHQRDLQAQQRGDADLDSYHQGIKDSAQRLRAVLGREGLIVDGEPGRKLTPRKPED